MKMKTQNYQELWNITKAVVRGKFIARNAHNSYKNKNKLNPKPAERDDKNKDQNQQIETKTTKNFGSLKR
jgi:hypothetical protein